ncbi:hypothetical protein MRB53_040112 [Persea americana]|nr:hypothetical protein MRB53_040112 [Persea americana]
MYRHCTASRTTARPPRCQKEAASRQQSEHIIDKSRQDKTAKRHKATAKEVRISSPRNDGVRGNVPKATSTCLREVAVRSLRMPALLKKPVERTTHSRCPPSEAGRLFCPRRSTAVWSRPRRGNESSGSIRARPHSGCSVDGAVCPGLAVHSTMLSRLGSAYHGMAWRVALASAIVGTQIPNVVLCWRAAMTERDVGGGAALFNDLALLMCKPWLQVASHVANTLVFARAETGRYQMLQADHSVHMSVESSPSCERVHGEMWCSGRA